MEESKNEKIKHDIKNSSKNEEAYNRKNVDIIKKGIVFFLGILCLIPVFLCIHLAGKLDDMDKHIEVLENELSEKEEIIYSSDYGDETVMSDDDLMILDQEAEDDIGKNTAEENNILSSSDGNTDSVGAIERGNGKKVYLTFDDGPSSYTDEILDILEEKNVKATFFVVYNPNQDLWDEYSSIVEKGHTLGMHSYTHVYEDIYAGLDAFKKDVRDIHDFLYEQTGVDSTYYRFPGGSSNTVADVDMQLLLGYLEEEGYTYYDWNSLSGDAVDGSLSPTQLNENVLKYVRNNPGDSIVLLHDLEYNSGTVLALPELIDTLLEEGYEICPIDEYTAPVQHVTYIQED